MRVTSFGLCLIATCAAAIGCSDSDAEDGIGDAGNDVVEDGGGACAAGEIEGPAGRCYMRIMCPDTIPTFTLGLEASGDDDLYKAVIVDARPSPPQQFLNAWVVDIVDMDDAPVADAVVDDVFPFMPAHGHDGIRIPEWDAMDEPGRFDVRVINLWMPGPWTVTFDVTGPDGSDSIVFDVCI